MDPDVCIMHEYFENYYASTNLNESKDAAQTKAPYASSDANGMKYKRKLLRNNEKW